MATAPGTRWCRRRARKQNIVEGSKVSGTSKKLELNLTCVARASLEELLEDYRDFMRDREIAEWGPDHPCTRRMRELNRQPDANYATFRMAIEYPDPAVCVNAIAGLVKLTNYLLDRLIRSLEREFLEHGGLSEAMTRARLARRRQGKDGKDGKDGSDGSN